MLRVFCVEVLVLVIHTSSLVMLMLEVTVGSVAKAARKQLEGKLGRSVISSEKASDYLLPANDNNEEE